MSYQTTTWQRAVASARKLQPETIQQENSFFFFKVASTSMLDAWHYVTLGPNKANVLKDSKCDCGQSRHGCNHRGAALLQLVSNLEDRLWTGGDYIVRLADNQGNQEELSQANDLYVDLLDRFERGVDLIQAIEAGQDFSNFIGKPKKTDLAPDKEQKLLSA